MNTVIEKAQVISTPKTAFHKAIEGVETIEFDMNWKNGTGYLDHAVKGEHAPILKPGQVVQSVDDYGRKIGIVGTSVGNVVVFDRFVDPENSVVVTNGPSKLEQLIGLSDGSLYKRDIDLIFGDGVWTYNVGKRLGALFAEIA
jgi:hypothetical protein